MADEQELREWIREVQRGRLSRRGFVHRLVGLGLTVPFANYVLTACGGAAPAAPPTGAPAAQATGAPAAAARPAAPTVAGPAAGMQAAASPLAAASGGPKRTRRGGAGTVKALWWQAPSHANAHLSTGTKDFDAARLFTEP